MRQLSPSAVSPLRDTAPPAPCILTPVKMSRIFIALSVEALNLLLMHRSKVIYRSEESGVQLLSLAQLTPAPTARSRPEWWSHGYSWESHDIQEWCDVDLTRKKTTTVVKMNWLRSVATAHVRQLQNLKASLSTNSSGSYSCCSRSAQYWLIAIFFTQPSAIVATWVSEISSIKNMARMDLLLKGDE